MNINQILNEFDRYYGKVHKITSVLTYESHILIGVTYNTGKIILKLWVKENKPDYIQTTEDTYDYILFKDRIYTNDYIMKDKDDRIEFYNALNKYLKCHAEYLFGSWNIDLDGKILRSAYNENHKQIKKYSEVLNNRNIYNQKSYNFIGYKESLNNLSYSLMLEKALGQLIETKNMK